MNAVIKLVTNWDIINVTKWGMLWGLLYMTFFVGITRATFVFLSWLNGELLTLDLGLVLVSFFAVGLCMFLLPPVPGVPVYIMGGILLGSRFSRPCEPDLLKHNAQCSELNSTGPFVQPDWTTGRLGYWFGQGRARPAEVRSD